MKKIGFILVLLLFMIYSCGTSEKYIEKDLGSEIIIEEPEGAEGEGEGESEGEGELPEPPPPPEKNYVETLNVSYGSDRQQKFDHYIPQEFSDYLFIAMHGGSWIGGDKNYMKDISVFFAERGHTVCNMNYRLSLRFKFPAPLEDLAALMNYVLKDKTKFKLNENLKTVFIGHSAGAHLTALYGLKENEFSSGHNIDYIVGLAGPYDVFDENVDQDKMGLYDFFMGDADKVDGSPAQQIKDGESSKYLLLLGDEDDKIPVSQNELFEAALNEKNVYVESYIYAGKHHDTIYKTIPDEDEVALAILSFISK